VTATNKPLPQVPPPNAPGRSTSQTADARLRAPPGFAPGAAAAASARYRRILTPWPPAGRDAQSDGSQGGQDAVPLRRASGGL